VRVRQGTLGDIKEGKVVKSVFTLEVLHLHPLYALRIHHDEMERRT
jgi:hypothetical protein